MPKALFFHTNLFIAGVISSHCTSVRARHFYLYFIMYRGTSYPSQRNRVTS